MAALYGRRWPEVRLEMIEDEIQALNTGTVTVIARKPLYDIYRDASRGLKTFSPIQYHKPCIPFPQVQKYKARKVSNSL